MGCIQGVRFRYLQVHDWLLLALAIAGRTSEFEGLPWSGMNEYKKLRIRGFTKRGPDLLHSLKQRVESSYNQRSLSLGCERKQLAQNLQN